MTRILLCDTKKNYCELLDEIFNVKFIKRAMQLKAMVDCQIMAIHPHMTKIIAYYDLPIHRYYSPVWNRNGEEEDDDDDKKEKKQLDTGGLEKGRVEIIVLKAVTKKKNKNKKQKDEEEKEKDEKEEKNDGFEDGEKEKPEEK